jgi:UDPglucose--hexose-1-phosphate uridylyltransferase
VAPFRTDGELADGRRIYYYDDEPGHSHPAHDDRHLPGDRVRSEIRHDVLLDEPVVVSAARQQRTHLPPMEHCPLCPSAPGRATEIPSPAYDVAVFDNRFPALPADPAGGRCEVICFSSDHHTPFSRLFPHRVATVVGAWIDRTDELSALDGVEQVYCFENRGREIGVTLSHPHGQIYAYPFVTPRTRGTLVNARQHLAATGRNLFDDVLAFELAEGTRVITAGAHWVSFVPYAARWPFEVHLYPRRRVPGLAALTAEQQAAGGAALVDVLARFDRLFGEPAPYIAGWHQAPVHEGRDLFGLHAEVFSVRRAPDKLKYLAGSESGMGAFLNDIAPEEAAERLRSAGP